MNCSHCGSYMPPGVRFCSACGAPAEQDPEATRLARPSTDRLVDRRGDIVEQTIFAVQPTMIFIGLGYLLAIVAAVALVIVLARLSAPAFISILLGLAFLAIPAYYHIRRNTIRYTLTDSKLAIDRGLIARTTRNIPLSKIQDVTVSASISQRLFGFGDVIVDNASEVGGTTVLHNINSPRTYADMLLRELRHLQ